MAQSLSHQQDMSHDGWLGASSASTMLQQTHHNTRERKERETIHSGQFMVSHFEAEAQDDEDNGITMPDDDENGITEVTTCNNVQLLSSSPIYNECSSSSAIVPVSNSSAVIDISLAKLFKCMNLAYRQKLTSPKWNSFKGVRLRWKDKIRLNNLIWRCWHMQFILRKKMLVCQFASPLDVDIHSKPEAVVLEGKYWKRQFDVIKAEYMKWRKFHRNRGLGNHALMDTVSEIDILDWSPCTSDKSLLGVDDYYWTSDTLFSTINTPFPFPDAREIARAGIADFIQPSLGPLQPNLDDFMNSIPLQELISSHMNSRLPPVPEEGTDDMLFRSDAYDFPALMGPEGMDSGILPDASSLADVNTGVQSQPVQSCVLSQPSSPNMLQFNNTPVNQTSMQYQKLYGTQNVQQMNQNINAVTLSSSLNHQPQMQSQMNVLMNAGGNYMSSSPEHQSDALINMVNSKKRQIKNSYRPNMTNRREPVNYDKSVATQHQTNLYHQMLAQQNRNQQQLQTQQLQQSQHMQQQQQQQQLPDQVGVNNVNFNSTNLFIAPQNMQSNPVHISPIQTTTNNYMNAINLSQTNNYPATSNQLNQNLLHMVNPTSLQQQQSPPRQHQQSNIKQSTNLLSLLSMKSPPSHDIDAPTSDSFKATSAAHQNVAPYKPYPTQQSLKSSSYNQLSPRSMRLTSPPNPLLADRQHQLSASANIDKEMYRSKSLPLNSSLQLPIIKDESFVKPKYQTVKSTSLRSRVRSNSMASKQHGSNVPPLQTAASEPMLQTLAQLLTSSSANNKTVSQQQQQQQQQQQHQHQQLGLTNSLLSPTQRQQLHQQQQQQQNQQQIQQQQRSFIIHQNPTQNPTIISSPSGLQLSSTPNSPHGSYLVHSNSAGNLVSTPSLSPEPVLDQDSPASPSRASNLIALPKYPRSAGASGSATNTAGDTVRRAGHIHAEQKRRYNIKNGFDMLHSLIPQLQQNPNAKLSKAAMLQKGAEYIRQMRADRDAVKQKMEILKKERDSLNNSLNHLHSVLPANGAPVARQRTSRIKEMYSDYVRERTLRNWKFWILGLIFEPLLNSYNATVSVASADELHRSAVLWVDQHCSLVEIRPAVSDKLRYLSTTTDILSDPPSTLQDEVIKALSSNSNMSNM